MGGSPLRLSCFGILKCIYIHFLLRSSLPYSRGAKWGSEQRDASPGEDVGGLASESVLVPDLVAVTPHCLFILVGLNILELTVDFWV